MPDSVLSFYTIPSYPKSDTVTRLFPQYSYLPMLTAKATSQVRILRHT